MAEFFKSRNDEIFNRTAAEPWIDASKVIKRSEDELIQIKKLLN